LSLLAPLALADVGAGEGGGVGPGALPAALAQYLAEQSQLAGGAGEPAGEPGLGQAQVALGTADASHRHGQVFALRFGADVAATEN